MHFSSPWGGLVALGALLPLAALVASERRVRRLRRVLGLSQPPAREVLLAALAVCAVPLLAGFAAAQPVLERTKVHYVRTDAEAFFVLDTSRSMLASSSAGGTPRFERARKAALRLRSELPDVPAGIASLTDRLLPHLFPTSNASAFAGTLERALGVERPPPQLIAPRATSYFQLTSLATQNYFSDSAKRRLAIVFTDGESSPFEESEVAGDFRGAHIRLLFVRFWNKSDRVFGHDAKPESYRPDPASGGDLHRLADALGARVFSEHDLGGVAKASRAALGRGPRVSRGRDEHSVALGPYAAFAALFPLVFLLWWRNLWGLPVQRPGTPLRQMQPV